MKPNDLLFITFKSLSSNPLRSFLSSLGVFMGVFAISGTLQVSDIGKSYLTNQLQEIELPQIFAFSPYDLSTYQQQKYRLEDLEWLKKRLQGWNYIIPMEYVTTDNIFYGSQKINTQAQAVTPDFLKVTGRKLVLGSFITINDFKQNSPVVIIDQLVAQSLFKGQNPIGKKVFFQNKSYYVKGVIQTKKSSADSGKEGLMLMSLSLYQSIKSNTSFDRIIITPSQPDDLEKLQNQAVELLKKRFKNKDLYAYSNVESVKMLEKVLNGVTIVLLLIGGIALLVGGVGIANITIASVVERTSEIGLRRAIGATKNDIMIQFLLEATIISITGGVIAITLVQGITIIVVNIISLPYLFNFQTPFLSLSAAIMVGITSSFLPAMRASKLDPVEALRSK